MSTTYHNEEDRKVAFSYHLLKNGVTFFLIQF
jgi:hypothetical protein